jgi:hypothetical protein
MRNYFLALLLAVLVVLSGVTVRRSVAGIGTSPAPMPPIGIGTSPAPMPPISVMGIGTSPAPMPKL